LHWLHVYLGGFTVVPSSPDLCRKWAEVMRVRVLAGDNDDGTRFGS
jgi:hypothetical protein